MSIDKDDLCIWVYADPDWSAWETDCKQTFCLTDGTPEKNNFRYCCYCGKKLQQLIPVQDPWDEDPLERMNEHE